MRACMSKSVRVLVCVRARVRACVRARVGREGSSSHLARGKPQRALCELGGVVHGCRNGRNKQNVAEQVRVVECVRAFLRGPIEVERPQRRHCSLPSELKRRVDCWHEPVVFDRWGRVS